MSLFLPQQNIPFQCASRYLRAFAPNCQLSVDEWAHAHAGDMSAGDTMIVFQPVFSPWGDSSALIGAADDDSLKTVQLVHICQDQSQEMAIIVSPEEFRKDDLQSYLKSAAGNAKASGEGFYYALIRSQGSVDIAAMANVASQCTEHGLRGGAGIVDVSYLFFQAIGALEELPEAVLDIAAFGYLLFLDKEPLAGSKQPDLRSVLLPVAVEEREEAGALAYSAIVELSKLEPAVSTALASVESVGAASPELPKRPSFFSQLMPGLRSKLPEPQSSEQKDELSQDMVPGAMPLQADTEFDDLSRDTVKELVPDELPETVVQHEQPENTTPSNTPPATSVISGVNWQHTAEPQRKTSAGAASDSPDGESDLSLLADTVAAVAGGAPTEQSPKLDVEVAPAEPAAAASVQANAQIATSRTANAGSPDSRTMTKAAPSLSQIAPLPPGQKKAETLAPAPATTRSQAKDLPAVKSGIAGVASRLEQQASKASGKLELQVDEIQARLSDEFKNLLGKVEASEKRSVKSAEGLRRNLTHRLDNAANEVMAQISQAAAAGADTIAEHQPGGCKLIEEKYEHLRTTLCDAFDAVKVQAEAAARAFENNAAQESAQALADLEQLYTSIASELEGLQTNYEKNMQSSFDHFHERLDVAASSFSSNIERRRECLHEELADLHCRCLMRLEQTKTHLLQELSGQFIVAQAELNRLQAATLEDNVLSRLRQHYHELRTITGEFQFKLASDLEKKNAIKISEFEPILEEKKQKLSLLLSETIKIKDDIQEQLKVKLEAISTQLQEFVAASIERAQNAYRETEERLLEVDRAVRALADPSAIEGDLQLLNGRREALEKMDEAASHARGSVMDTLRQLLAGLEEKSKHLQEGLIGSMEEDAYLVRRASEQALVAVREAINETFMAIQAAQDEQMPM